VVSSRGPTPASPPEKIGARLQREAAVAAFEIRRQERDADIARWTRVAVYVVLGSVAFATGLAAFLSTDPSRRDLGQKVAVPIVTGFVGFFLGKKDS
jgi:hypothetical protein